MPLDAKQRFDTLLNKGELRKLPNGGAVRGAAEWTYTAYCFEFTGEFFLVVEKGSVRHVRRIFDTSPVGSAKHEGGSPPDLDFARKARQLVRTQTLPEGSAVSDGRRLLYFKPTPLAPLKVIRPRGSGLPRLNKPKPPTDS
ncbi:hypothetical protein [Oleiharenicola lentus]|uniref:hypothetical protein n=1 Tax=Oleiharenicola lentus TaxID=2508720 RepID=UPI003F67BD6B